MSLVEVSVLNPHATSAAWYEVTLEFTTADGAVFATRTAYFGRAEPGKRAEKGVPVARPTVGDGLGVSVVHVKQGLLEATSAVPSPSPPTTAMDFLVGELVRAAGAIPSGTPYGVCPSGSPQRYWLDDIGNCQLPPLLFSPAPTPVPVPGYPGTLCGDGWTSTSAGRGTCSHHGGIAHAR
ncbi:hypothetical protein [Streptomyces sp. NBC_00503]|uniref:hypothetical protein n=1 Tax=Streptomyces sp. NBC_00503 TaxID=2903659 RepID=UPI002E812D82|nr:hypothetical protein [Streptomyces sp. NBC_00503]WUD79716.1 hypothetical protein OG490_03475 [Streptomyces sp. NBC_00503]